MKKTQKIRVFSVRQSAPPKLLKNKGFIPWNNPFFSCNLSLFSVLYMYIMIKKTLTERIKEARKRNYLTLLDILDILITNQKKGLI